MTFLHQTRCAFLSLSVVLLMVPNLPFITAKWSAEFEPTNITIHMHETVSINLTLTGLDTINVQKSKIYLISDTNVFHVNKQINNSEIQNGKWTGDFKIDAIFLGSGYAQVMVDENGLKEPSDERLRVIIVRQQRLIDTLFTVSVAVLVSILNVNFGAALELDKLKGILKKPIGPAIGLFCHFLFMPLVSSIHHIKFEEIIIRSTVFIFR